MKQTVKELEGIDPRLARVLVGMGRVNSRAVFYRTVAVVAVILLAVVAVLAASQYSRAEDASRAATVAAQNAQAASRSTRSSLVEVCEASTRPGGVRYVLADQIRDQIRQSRNPNLTRFFPTIPPEELHRLIARQNKHRRQQIQTLLNVDCAALYPPTTPSP